ncbi:MAG: alpha-glucosidase [Acidobacteriaceae bacterium]|nr:alpha-glucosidase [Acidobacteriaceae bacterium]
MWSLNKGLVAGFLTCTLGSLWCARCVAQESQQSADPWWKHAVIYEIYPRSFQDSNGDGIGDLNGITQRLDYLKDLGVDAIWIAPCYPSPQVDFGYDISDYQNIDPMYGTLADFDRLTAEAKKRNIRVIMDAVLNHTSDKHAWFTESASSRTNPKSDWYVWRDGKGPGQPPNNWLSTFGHSAWQFNPKRDQYYYHYFYIQQPDLNWRNPEVENAVFNMLRFWLDRGVAGFRLDAIPTLFEDPSLKDEKVLPGKNKFGDPNESTELQENLPECHDVIRRMRSMADTYPDNRVLIGETYLPNVEELDKWYGGEKHDELDLPMDMQVGFEPKLDANEFRKRISDAETKIHGSHPLFVFDNHDNPRSAYRYGDGVHNKAIDQMLATILFTTRSTALMYYGDEIEMPTTVPTSKAQVKDPIGITGWPKEKGRDGERTPMQWNGSTAAGFSTNPKTWLPVAADYKRVNVEAESKDPDSMLNWYKKLIALRRSNPALHDGEMKMLDVGNQQVVAWSRTAPDGKVIVVACSFTAQPQVVSFDTALGGSGKTATTLAASGGAGQKNAVNLNSVSLAAFGSIVAEVN